MKAILLILWMIFTIILTASILGILLFLPTHYTTGEPTPSTWMQIEKSLTEAVLKK